MKFEYFQLNICDNLFKVVERGKIFCFGKSPVLINSNYSLILVTGQIQQMQCIRDFNFRTYYTDVSDRGCISSATTSPCKFTLRRGTYRGNLAPVALPLFLYRADSSRSIHSLPLNSGNRRQLYKELRSSGDSPYG